MGEIIEGGEVYAAPWVDPELCVGCGACHNLCHRVNVVEGALLAETAIRVGPVEGRK